MAPPDDGLSTALAVPPGVLGGRPLDTLGHRCIARVRGLIRRNRLDGEHVLRFADLRLDPDTREVRRARRAIELTPLEFRLLELFLRSPRRVLTRSQIFNQVWGFDFGVMSNSLNVYVGNLRRKTEASGEPRLIYTVRGVGYILREPAGRGL